MNKWKLTIISILTVAFIGVNLFLLLKESSKAERVSYIHDWTRVQLDDIAETFQTKGIVKPETQQGVYYDEQQGPISSILVKEGDTISSGTPLFSYSSKALEEEKSNLEDEIEQIQGEIDSVNEELKELEGLDTPSSSANNSSTGGNEDVKVHVNVDVTNGVKTDVEKAIIAAESEISKLEAKLSKYENRLKRVSDQINETTVNSDVEGKVIAINRDMKNPIITVASNTLTVEGELTEKQMKKAAVDNEVKMYSSLHEKKYKGSIQQIVPFPNGNPSFDKETKYPFFTTLEDADEQLLPGAKLNMKVIVNEVQNVPVVATESVIKKDKKKYVYRLTEKGTVSKTKITTGLSFEGDQEVVKGIQKGQIITMDPKQIMVNKSTFITPMTTTSIQKSTIKKLTKKQMAKYVLMGVFEK